MVSCFVHDYMATTAIDSLTIDIVRKVVSFLGSAAQWWIGDQYSPGWRFIGLSASVPQSPSFDSYQAHNAPLLGDNSSAKRVEHWTVCLKEWEFGRHRSGHIVVSLRLLQGWASFIHQGQSNWYPAKPPAESLLKVVGFVRPCLPVFGKEALLGVCLPIMGVLVHIAMRTPITLDFQCAWIRSCAQKICAWSQQCSERLAKNTVSHVFFKFEFGKLKTFGGRSTVEAFENDRDMLNSIKKKLENSSQLKKSELF